MRYMKKYILVVALILVAVILTGCQESPEAKYNRAVGLVSEGKYEEAIPLFEENSAYGDSNKMAMYTKAIMAGEKGDYETAFSGFEALGDFKDSPMMITYYTGRQYESQAGDENWNAWLQAAETYEKISLFQDSADRAAACRRAVYDYAVSKVDEGDYDMAYSVLDMVGVYEDSLQLIDYCGAFLQERNDRFTNASEMFSHLGDYRDSAEQATAVLQRGYDKASGLEASGDREGAYQIWISLEGFSDSFERAKKTYYDLGVSKREAGDWDGAVAAFEHAGTYSDAKEQVPATRYAEGEAKREAKDWDGAVTAFEQAGTYSDAAEQVSATHYLHAEDLEASGDQEGAYQIWIGLGDYKDSFDRANKPYYDLGVSKREAGVWNAAVAAFEHAGTYSDAREQIPATRYMQAEDLEVNGNQDGAYKIWISLGDYKDSFERANKPYYDLGVSKREAKDWDGAVAAFEHAGAYHDAADQILATRYMQAEDLEANGDQEGAYQIWIGLGNYSDSFERANKPYYDLGISKREAGEWDAAVAAFEHAGTYGDTAEQIPATRYAEGEAKREAKDWDGAVVVFESLGEYNDAATQIIETRYLQAKSLMDSGDYAGAAVIMIEIKGYKNVDSLLENDENLAAAAASEAKRKPFRTVGGIVTFGKYPQTADGRDETPIEWIVLEYDETNHRVLLLSKYGLDAKPYNNKPASVTWETCSLRTWLNQDFLNRAFTAEEQSAILMTDVDNSDAQGYSEWSTTGRNNTRDRIFLLSYVEANRYLSVTDNDTNNTASRVAPTAYAIKQEASTYKNSKTADGSAAGWWWLRSPGQNHYYAAYVGTDGALSFLNVYYGSGCVRPAFWINLESDYFNP